MRKPSNAGGRLVLRRRRDNAPETARAARSAICQRRTSISPFVTGTAIGEAQAVEILGDGALIIGIAGAAIGRPGKAGARRGLRGSRAGKAACDGSWPERWAWLVQRQGRIVEPSMVIDMSVSLPGTATTLSLVLLASPHRAACGRRGLWRRRAMPCRVASGSYHAAAAESRLPPAPRPGGAVLPWRRRARVAACSSPARICSPFVEAGYVVLGADGLMRPGNAFGTGWSFRPEGPQQRDELAFAREVLADAVQRFGIDRNRILVSGFSIGASLIWYLACRDPGLGRGLCARRRRVLAAASDSLRRADRPAAQPWLARPDGAAGGPPAAWRRTRAGRYLRGAAALAAGQWLHGHFRPDSFETGPVFWLRTWKACDSGREIVAGAAPFRP